MISTDKNIFNEDSGARQRMIEYGKLAEELYIIVFNLRSSVVRQNFGNVFIYPTNSKSRWFYICDAVKIGKKITATKGQWLITSQDPFECGLAGWLISKIRKIPLQLQIHTDFLSPYFWEESILNKVRVFIAKFLIPRADCLRVVSERIKKSLKRDAFVLPIFVDVEKIRNTPIKTNLHQKYPQFDFIILMASRLTKEKNISLAIEAVKEINNIKVGLVIVGNGPEKENYELCKNIIIEPWTDDLISYYKTADLFLLTSNYEGYGMTVVEAMAAGCPVIMTDVGLANKVLVDKKDGLVIPVGDKEKLIEAILNLIKNPELRADLIRNFQKIMNFWPKKEDYLKAYRDSWLLCRNSIMI
ncbi:MAG: glycosyltransferase [Candidatus Parcubacteria bacterium]|nr:glycosyltransferase [Candidatus Parcubacteria bacterium]